MESNMESISSINSEIKKYKIVFWDFDGVIKESVSLKNEAFLFLFDGHGELALSQIRNHLRFNCGMSRYEKIPIYLKTVGLIPDILTVEKYCQKYSELVKDLVINSKWVAGVQEYVLQNYRNQKYYLVTATPQSEIEYILEKICFSEYFQGVFGSPTNKVTSIKQVMRKNVFDPQFALLIGDSITDMRAALDAGIDFFLRETDENSQVHGAKFKFKFFS